MVADQSLQVGTPLDEHNTRTISWPADEPLAGSFQRIEDCAGRAVITPMTENEPVLEANLAPKAAGAGLPATIPAGMRAVSVAVNDVVGVAGFAGAGGLAARISLELFAPCPSKPSIPAPSTRRPTVMWT